MYLKFSGWHSAPQILRIIHAFYFITEEPNVFVSQSLSRASPRGPRVPTVLHRDPTAHFSYPRDNSQDHTRFHLGADDLPDSNRDPLFSHTQ